MMTILKTGRLLLRPQVAADAEAIVRGLSDYEVARHLTVVPFPYTAEDAQSWLARVKPPTPAASVFSIEVPGLGMVGTVSLVDELGYWIARPFWGQGFATEASRRLLAWHFAETAAERVRSSAHAGNDRSLAVQRKLGFVETGSGRRFVRSQGREVEHIETVLARTAFAAAGEVAR